MLRIPEDLISSVSDKQAILTACLFPAFVCLTRHHQNGEEVSGILSARFAAGSAEDCGSDAGVLKSVCRRTGITGYHWRR